MTSNESKKIKYQSRTAFELQVNKSPIYRRNTQL